MTKKNKNLTTTIVGLVIFMILTMLNSFRIVFNEPVSGAGLGFAIASPIIVSFLIPIIIVISVLSSNKNTNKTKNSDRTTGKLYSKGSENITILKSSNASVNNEKNYANETNSLNNVAVQEFPCENCGTMLQPGTLFCFNCDTKVDYSRFKK